MKYNSYWRKRYMPDFLSEMSKLLTVRIDQSDVVTLDDLATIRSKSSGINRSEMFKMTISFSDKANILKKIFYEIESLSKKEIVYIFTTYSEYCGSVILKNISDFNCDFNFEDEHAGIISIVDKNMANEIILDFSEEYGKRILEIEIFGVSWPSVGQRLAEMM